MSIHPSTRQRVSEAWLTIERGSFSKLVGRPVSGYLTSDNSSSRAIAKLEFLGNLADIL